MCIKPMYRLIYCPFHAIGPPIYVRRHNVFASAAGRVRSWKAYIVRVTWLKFQQIYQVATHLRKKGKLSQSSSIAANK